MPTLLERLPPDLATPLRRVYRQQIDPRLAAAVDLLGASALFSSLRRDFKTLIKRHPRLGTQVAIAVGQYIAAREALLRDALAAADSPASVHRLVYGLRVPEGTCDPMPFFR